MCRGVRGRLDALIFVCLLVLLALGTACDPSGATPDDEPVEELVIDGSDEDDIPEVSGPYSSEELQEILDAFRWEAEEPWEEEQESGTPILYYVELLTPSVESTDELTSLDVPWDYLPLFDEEYDGPEGEMDIVNIEAIAAGRLVFAIFPGEAYNLIREEALNGNVIYPFMRKRTIPLAYRLADGSLDPRVYVEFLGALMLDEASGSANLRMGVPDIHESALFGKIFRSVQRAFRKVGTFFREEIVAESRKKRNLEFQLVMHERDSRFFSEAPGEPTLLIRAWGDEAGRLMFPEGALVAINAGLIAKTTAHITESGEMRIRIPRNNVKKVTIDLDNPAAALTVMGYGFRRLRLKTRLSSGRGDVQIKIIDPHVDLYSLAIFTDAYKYSIAAFDVAPTTAMVAQMRLKGNMIDRSFATVESLLDMATLQAYTSGLALPIDTLLDFDILIAEKNRSDRITLYHEYGHWVLATILSRSHKRNLSHFWGMNLQSAIRGEPAMEGAHISRMVNEGFADFFSIMTTGGASYGRVLATPGCTLREDRQRLRCFEENVGSSDTAYWDIASNPESPPPGYPYQGITWPNISGRIGGTKDHGYRVRNGVSVVSTFLIDLVDGGHAPPLSAGLLWSKQKSGAIQPAGGAAWREHASDERIAISGQELVEGLEAWIRDFSPTRELDQYFDALLHDGFAGAMASVALERHSEKDVCELFSLHSPTRACPQLGAAVVEAWEQIEPAKDLVVIPVTHISGSSPTVLVAWRKLPRRGDVLDLELRTSTGDVHARATYQGRAVPLFVISDGLVFDEAYVLHATVRRGEAMSIPQVDSVVTAAERPFDLQQEAVGDFGIRVRWTSKATEYRVVLEGQSSGLRVERFETDPEVMLYRWDFPPRESIDVVVGGGKQASVFGPELDEFATIRVYASNRIWEESLGSRTVMEVVMPSGSAPMNTQADSSFGNTNRCTAEGLTLSMEMQRHTEEDPANSSDDVEGHHFAMRIHRNLYKCQHSELLVAADGHMHGFALCYDSENSEPLAVEFLLDLEDMHMSFADEVCEALLPPMEHTP